MGMSFNLSILPTIVLLAVAAVYRSPIANFPITPKHVMTSLLPFGSQLALVQCKSSTLATYSHAGIVLKQVNPRILAHTSCLMSQQLRYFPCLLSRSQYSVYPRSVSVELLELLGSRQVS